jgi:hypothetical protein
MPIVIPIAVENASNHTAIGVIRIVLTNLLLEKSAQRQLTREAGESSNDFKGDR